MNLQKPNWKLVIKNPEILNSKTLFKIFNSWIPASEEIFVDVADYTHVQDGPKVVLVGHYVDYSWDHTDRVHGFLYNRRQPMDGTNEVKLKTSLQAFIRAAKRFQSAPEWETKPVFDTTALTLIINDRGLAPNNRQTFDALNPDLDQIFPKASIAPNNETKKRFSVSVETNLDSLTQLEATYCS